ncbi:MAG TPA: radical SAM protein [Nitrospirota bacterium]|nr:radical SAM protein [Nitrospirota bacterium]
MDEPVNSYNDLIKIHPCFSEQDHNACARIYLPVAPDCNIHCRYCNRTYDCVNESRHGVISTTLSPKEAIDNVESLIRHDDNIRVICVAGPGESLANETILGTLQSISRKFPNLILCVSTNGLLLYERLEGLVKAGVKALTITINAVTLKTAEKIYSKAYFHGQWYEGSEAADIILMKQWQGLINVIDAGLIVKVNSVLIPGVNDQDIPFIAEHAGHLGADLMQILPLTWQSEFGHTTQPELNSLATLRNQCESFISQMDFCQKCSSDRRGTYEGIIYREGGAIGPHIHETLIEELV